MRAYVDFYSPHTSTSHCINPRSFENPKMSWLIYEVLFHPAYPAHPCESTKKDYKLKSKIKSTAKGAAEFRTLQVRVQYLFEMLVDNIFVRSDELPTTFVNCQVIATSIHLMERAATPVSTEDFDEATS